jgi:hypothetical protein
VIVVCKKGYVCSKAWICIIGQNIHTINVHTWTSALLRYLANTSFMVPFWPHTEPGSAPIPVCEHLEATLVQRMLFIALMAVAQVSPNVFCSEGAQLLTTYKWTLQHIFVRYTHVFIYITWHTAYVLSTSHSCTVFTLSSFLHLFWSSWQAGCLWLLMSDTITVRFNHAKLQPKLRTSTFYEQLIFAWLPVWYCTWSCRIFEICFCECMFSITLCKHNKDRVNAIIVNNWYFYVTSYNHRWASLLLRKSLIIDYRLWYKKNLQLPIYDCHFLRLRLPIVTIKRKFADYRYSQQ